MNRRKKLFLSRFFTIFLMITTIYFLHCLLLTKTDYLIFRKRTKTKLNTDFQLERKLSATSKTDSERDFQKEDMFDEFGNPYKVIIWSKKKTVNYIINKHTCRANISCEVKYSQSDNIAAHAVVFKAEELSKDIVLPSVRDPLQSYVWWSKKSPLYTPKVPAFLDSYFNLTMHYRDDADIFDPFGSLPVILNDILRTRKYDLTELLNLKFKANKTASWVDNDCYHESISFGKSLIELGLDVDAFGDCFENPKPRKVRFYDFLSQYKFHLAFEDSFDCKDYFTQKFWYYSLLSGAVPVVWGPPKEDLLKFAPSKSFIHADDFTSKQELVNYLKFLSTNMEEYAEYLEWRIWAIYPFQIDPKLRENDGLLSFCKLCSILQQDGRKRKLNQAIPSRLISSINDVWLGPENEKCYQ